MEMTRILPATRVKAELLDAIRDQAGRLKVRKSDVIRLALALGVEHLRVDELSKREEAQCQQ